MRYSVAVPALSQHSDAHDTPNVSPRRMKGAAKFLCRLNKFLGVDRLPLPIPCPVCLPDGIQCETHPSRLITLCTVRVCLLHDLGVHPYSDDIPIAISQLLQPSWWKTCRRLILSDPLVNHFCKLGILHNQDVNRFSLARLTLPMIEFDLPEATQHCDRLLRPL